MGWGSNPGGGTRFSSSVQTGRGAHPTSCTIGTGSFPGVKRPGRGADHPRLSKRWGHERVGLYLFSPSGPQRPVIGSSFTFTLQIRGSVIFLQVPPDYNKSYHRIFILLVVGGPATHSFVSILTVIHSIRPGGTARFFMLHRLTYSFLR